MSRNIRTLTARAVEAKSEPGYHSDGDGLYLQVTAKGAKSWTGLARGKWRVIS